MEKEAIFSLTSMTKPIVSTALMMLWEDGKFVLEDPISKWLPSYGNKQVLDPVTGRPAPARPITQEPASWHPSGKFLAFHQLNPQSEWNLMILPMEGDEESGWRAGKSYSFSNAPFSEAEPMFSPDGRWIAYQSLESGRIEVYVRPFPGPGGKWQISNGGGALPTWSRRQHELFYGTPDHQIMVAAYTVEGDVFHAEKPRLWSGKRYMLRGGVRAFDLHPDGGRFALAPPVESLIGGKHDHVTVIFNVFDELRRIAPAARR